MTEANKIAKQCEADGKDKLEVISSKLQTDVTTNVVTRQGRRVLCRFAGCGLCHRANRWTAGNAGQGRRRRSGRHRHQKGDSQMDEAVQKAVQKLIDDGTYLKILKYWGVEDGAIETSEINTPGAE